MWGKIPDCYVKSRKKQKEVTLSGAVSRKARIYVYSVQLRFLSKLIIERQMAGSLLVDNTEESHVTTVEQYKNNMNNFS